MMFISWLKRASPAARAQLVRIAWLALGIGVLVLLILRGNWLVAALGVAIPLVQRLLTVTQLYGTVKSLLGSGARSHQGKRSEVETRFLRMVLDHDSGEMSGQIVEGRGKGRQLAELTLEQLLDVLDDYRRTDPQSANLLEAYLDRMHGSNWREAHRFNEASGRETASQGQMSREEAYAVLGLEPGASRAQVLEAHRRLMQKVHPDRGGSNFLAAQINQAKDIVLGTAV
jgi:hypothetical protein